MNGRNGIDPHHDVLIVLDRSQSACVDRRQPRVCTDEDHPAPERPRTRGESADTDRRGKGTPVDAMTRTIRSDLSAQDASAHGAIGQSFRGLP